MQVVNAKIYTDTNTLRYFGTAFAEEGLDGDLRDHLVMSPISVLELISQLCTPQADEAFAAIQAIPNTHNAAATGLLPWSGDVFRMQIFGLPCGDDTYIRSINVALNNCLNATQPAQLHKEALQLRELMQRIKAESVDAFTNVLNDWRHEGALDEQQHRAIFARSIATRADTTPDAVDVDRVITALDALYIFESGKIANAATEPAYNVAKHANDLYDAEQLVYLCVPELHFLTSDKGFNRSAASSQFNRLHIVPMEALRHATMARDLIRQIIVNADGV